MSLWHVDRDGGELTVRDENACTIARIEPRAAGADMSAEQAARLIAAAPAMLLALQTIALHAPSLDSAGIRGLCDEAIAAAGSSGPYALAGWGYDTAGGNFRRLSADVPVRLEPREYAKPGSVIAYRLDTGERMHIPKRAIVER